MESDLEISAGKNYLFNNKTASQRRIECDHQLKEISGSWDEVVNVMKEFYFRNKYDEKRFQTEKVKNTHFPNTQPCILNNCRTPNWPPLYDGTKLIVTPLSVNFPLWINGLTIHLAEQHHLFQERKLSDGQENLWGIDPSDFYIYFA